MWAGELHCDVVAVCECSAVRVVACFIWFFLEEHFYIDVFFQGKVLDIPIISGYR